MTEKWFCADCRVPVDLNMYGRCEHCDSDAVDSMHRLNLKQNVVADALAGSSAVPQFSGSI
jgi:hypothetical protein